MKETKTQKPGQEQKPLKKIRILHGKQEFYMANRKLHNIFLTTFGRTLKLNKVGPLFCSFPKEISNSEHWS
jgi:hypothetical protein